MQDEKNQGGINSILRAISILNLYRGGIKKLGITEMSKALKLPKSTIYRIVSTLEKEKWLIKDKDSEKYMLGFGILLISNEIRNQYDVKDIILEEMRSLSREVGETVFLSVYSNYMGICIERVEAENKIKLTSETGQVTPLHCGATGKVLLAYAPAEDIEKILEKDLERRTENTVTDKNILLKQLEEIRRNGYVISKAECDEGALGIGAPILDKDGQLLYGLSIAGPIERFESKGTDFIITKLIDAASRTSEKLIMYSL
jgi:IclR family transcriptional regulator, KDG regulon repressor